MTLQIMKFDSFFCLEFDLFKIIDAPRKKGNWSRFMNPAIQIADLKNGSFRMWCQGQAFAKCDIPQGTENTFKFERYELIHIA
jgi:hypothetical protein